jgi:hypothetical protein
MSTHMFEIIVVIILLVIMYELGSIQRICNQIRKDLIKRSKDRGPEDQ